MGLLTLLLGYLLGSIPSGYLAGRWCMGIDLRELGSGSTGATNVLRQVGKGPALVVFVIDVAKGAAAVLLAGALTQTAQLNDWIQVMAGLAALAGHIWPVWLGFKGGKAVATGLGMFLGLAWPVGLAFGNPEPQQILPSASFVQESNTPRLTPWRFILLTGFLERLGPRADSKLE